VLTFSSVLLNLAELSLSFSDAFLDTLIVVKRHVASNFRLPFRCSLTGLLRRVNIVHDLHITEALDWRRGIHANLAAAIMFHGQLITWDHLHLDKDKRDCAPLVFK